jgi:hypothetical protein
VLGIAAISFAEQSSADVKIGDMLTNADAEFDVSIPMNLFGSERVLGIAAISFAEQSSADVKIGDMLTTADAEFDVQLR